MTRHASVASYREDYQLEVIKHLDLLAAESFTNNPNNDKIGFTSLMVLFQDKLVIGKEVNFVPAGTFMHDKIRLGLRCSKHALSPR